MALIDKPAATLAALFVLLAWPAAPRAADTPPAPAPPAAKLYAVEFRTGPAWDHAKPPNEQRHFKEHSANLRRLREAGRLPLGARYGDKGLVIVSAPTIDEARTAFDNDPTVTDSVFVYTIAEFAVFYPGMVGPLPAPRETGPPPPSIDLPAELARVLTDYEAAWGAKDAAALAALFVEDGFVLSVGSPPVSGREAIQKHYAGQGGALALRAFAYAVDGSVATILGGYTSTRGTPDAGKFTLTLRRAPDGPWRIVSDMDNGNSRP